MDALLQYGLFQLMAVLLVNTDKITDNSHTVLDLKTFAAHVLNIN